METETEEKRRGKGCRTMCIFKYSNCRTYLRNVTKTKAARKRMGTVYYNYIYIYIVLASILRKCDRNNVRKNAKTIMRKHFSLWALKPNSSTSRRQADRIIPTPSTHPSYTCSSFPSRTQSIAKQNGPTNCSVFALGKLIA